MNKYHIGSVSYIGLSVCIAYTWLASTPHLLHRTAAAAAAWEIVAATKMRWRLRTKGSGVLGLAVMIKAH